MIGPVDREAGVGYLTLSVFAQSIVEWLVDPPSDSPDERGEFFNQVVRVLRSVKSSDRFKAELASGLRPFQDYEQVTTLYEVLATSRDEAKRKLDEQIKILEMLRHCPNEPDPHAVEETIRIFDRLATKALYYSRRPPPQRLPLGVYDLCRCRTMGLERYAARRAFVSRVRRCERLSAITSSQQRYGTPGLNVISFPGPCPFKGLVATPRQGNIRLARIGTTGRARPFESSHDAYEHD